MGGAFLVERTGRAHELAPALRLCIICTTDLKSLLLRDPDIAIRNVRPDLFARRVGHFRGNLYASKIRIVFDELARGLRRTIEASTGDAGG